MFVDSLSALLSNQGEKKHKLLFHKGSFKKKSIKVWYSKAQLYDLTIQPGLLSSRGQRLQRLDQ